jgi:hypothetical protein
MKLRNMEVMRMTIASIIRMIGCRTFGITWLLAMVWFVCSLIASLGVGQLTFFKDTILPFAAIYFSWRLIVYFAGSRKDCSHEELLPDES